MDNQQLTVAYHLDRLVAAYCRLLKRIGGLGERHVVASRIPAFAEEVGVRLCLGCLVADDGLHLVLCLAEELHLVRCGRNYIAFRIHGAVLGEVVGQAVVHAINRPTLNLAAVAKAKFALAHIKRGEQICHLRLVVPCTAQRYQGALRLYRATVEHITLVCGCYLAVVGGDTVAAAAARSTLLAVEQGVVEIHATATADEVHRTVNLAVLEPALLSGLVAIVGVLVREHAHAVASGASTFVLQADGTSVVGFVVVECVLQRQVLEDVVATRIEDGCRSGDTFYLGIGCILDDGAFHRLSLHHYMAGADSGQHGLAEVVNTIVKQYRVAVLQDIAYHHKGGSIAGCNVVYMSYFVQRSRHIIYLHRVDIRGGSEVEVEGVLRVTLYIERTECAVGGSSFFSIANNMHHSHRVACCIADNLVGGIGIGTETYRYVCFGRYHKGHLLPIAEDKAVSRTMLLARTGNQFVVFHVEGVLR